MAQADKFKFEQLANASGLSHNKVQCILQDKQGYLWFGTVNGLNRYDPYGFKLFQNIIGDSTTIANPDIISLYQDENDIIWIGTSTVLSSYNPRTEKFSNHYFKGFKGWIHDIREDKNGLLWLASDYGLYSFDRAKDKVYYHKTDDSGQEKIHGIVIDNDTLWLSSETGIRKYNKKTGIVKAYAVHYPAFSDISWEITHGIIKDRLGFVWMSTSGDGVYQLNTSNEQLTQFAISIPDTDPVKSRLSTQIMEDSDGKIWIGGEGLAVFDPAKQGFEFYPIASSTNEGIPGKVRAMLKDKSGIYWLGTERGIVKYDPKLYSFLTIKANYPYTLPGANTIVEDNDHDFWFGNYTGIGSLNPDNGVYNNYSEGLGIKNEPVFSSVPDRDGSLWFGSSSCLFHVLKNKSADGHIELKLDKRIAIPVAPKSDVTSLIFDPQGVLWAGIKNGGLMRYDPHLQTIKIYPGLADKERPFSYKIINALLAIPGDSLLIGTEGGGLLLMHTKSEKVEKVTIAIAGKNNSLDNAVVKAIFLDKSKKLWIGTENDGLWQTDLLFSNIKNYSKKNGLYSMNISQIVGDDLGQIWLNTNLGIEVIDPVNMRFIHYTAQDGININETGYLIRKSSGDLVRFDLNGLHIFSPSSVNSNKVAPPVYVNTLRVLDRNIPVYGDTTINLKYFQNYVSFGYVALNYTQYFKNRYAYKLTGLNNDWIEGDESRTISYANLSPGSYTFKVKASNNDDFWNDKGAQVTLVISPPFWATWWFSALAILLVIGSVYVLFQYSLHQKLKAFEIRNKISRDLHDEVGSTLSSIGFVSSMALNDNGNIDKMKHSLSSINDSSRAMLDAMNDIIWNIQPQNDILENIVARMMSYASELLEARKISMKYHIADNLKHLHLGLAVRHDFFVIFKEAVNNLAKYSSASEAYIKLDFISPDLVLTIKDNGKGFDPQNVSKGNGLKNMRSRADKIGAKYCLQTEPGKGTTVKLSIRPT